MSRPRQRPAANDDAAALRAAAARLLCSVVDGGASLSDHMAPALTQVSARDRGLLQEMVYGTLRWQLRLEGFAHLLLQKPLKSRDRDVHCLLLVGLYQLLYMRLPDYAAISTTAQAARVLGKPWAVAVLNGVLRNCQRRGAELGARVDIESEARYAHPRWLLQALRQDWPDHWQAIAEANNARAPMTLRVNLRHGSQTAYLARLQEAGIAARSAPYGAAAITVEEPTEVERLPGFAAGDVSVQDAAAQLTAEVLPVPAGASLLDACAAPGGKTALFLERYPHAMVTAVDVDPQRLERVRETLARLHLQATVRAGDAGRPAQWSEGQTFERILLDVPCSATGVIRRHPDIKALRRAADIDQLVTQQAVLLDGSWPLLNPGGILLYSTCSVLKRENVAQVTAFLARRDDAESLPMEVPWGRPQVHGRQLLPGDYDMDGFYFALLRKKATAGR